MDFVRTSVDPHGICTTGANTTVYNPRLVTDDDRQYLAYYGTDGPGDPSSLRVAVRDLPSGTWSVRSIGPAIGLHDGHYAPALGIGPAGHLFVCFNTRNSPIQWCRSTDPGSIAAFDDVETGMTGENEASACYPEFTRLADGTLLFGYRNGGSGSGNWHLNRWDPEMEAWDVVSHPITFGGEARNAYHWNLVESSDGVLHYAFCWRETPDVTTNSRLCYARSPDRGVTWERSTGEPYELPITIDSAEIIDPVDQDQGLINQGWAATNPRTDRLHVAYLRDDDAGHTQLYHAWEDPETGWQREAVTARTDTTRIAGGGVRPMPLGRPAIVVDDDGTVFIVTRDGTQGGYPLVFRRDAAWTVAILYRRNLVGSEIHLDRDRWRRDGVFSYIDQATSVNYTGDTTAWLAGGTTPIGVTDVEFGEEAGSTDGTQPGAPDRVRFHSAGHVGPDPVACRDWTVVCGLPYTELEFPATPVQFRMTARLTGGPGRLRPVVVDTEGDRHDAGRVLEWTAPNTGMVASDWMTLPAIPAGELLLEGHSTDDPPMEVNRASLALSYEDPEPSLPTLVASEDHR